MTRLGLIWAQSREGVIGADGGMPWHVPEDLAHFKEVTDSSAVIMGRKTWDSLPERFRPLPGRRNIVVTRQPEWSAAGAERADSLTTAIAHAADTPGERVWLIGGGELFQQGIGLADRLEVTELDVTVEGDTYAPSREGWHVSASEPATGWSQSVGGLRYRFVRLERSA